MIIIGAGGAGLAVLSSMRSRGFDAVILEKNTDIGGIWFDTHYSNLKLHSKSFNYCFIDFHAIKSKTENATRQEILSYMKEYVAEKKLSHHIYFNTRVVKIIRKINKKCEVYAHNIDSNEQLRFECDIVICATGLTNSGAPHLPHFDNEEKFQGVIVHSSQFNQKMLDDVLVNQKKVVVLGAGKSSHNILVLLKKIRENITWLYSKSMWSFSFEKIYHHKNKFSLYRLQLLYAYYLILLRLRRRFSKYNAILRWLQKPLVNTLFVNPLEHNADLFQNRRALMEKEELHYLRTIKSIKSTIHLLNENSITLSNGSTLEADYIICATGYNQIANLPKIMIEKNNGITEEYDPTVRNFMYNILDLEMPEIAFFMTEVIYKQQLLSFSIAGQWLANFYQGTLPNKANSFDYYAALMAKSRTKWHVPNRYLSNGATYSHEKSDINVLPLMLHDLALDKKLAKELLYSLDKDAFDVVIQKIKNKLKTT